ncbi:MAG: putative peptidoglycan glycosyltransferase FtsW, partial [Phycisphaerae bacterium]
MTTGDRIDPAGRSAATGIILCSTALLAVGVIAVASASSGVDGPVLRRDFWNTAAGKQGLFGVAAVGALLLLARVGPSFLAWRSGRWWQPSLFVFLAAMALLVLTLVPGIGVERNGARRWLGLVPGGSGLVFQPSELAKVALPVFLAAYLSGRGETVRRFVTGVLPAALAITVCAGLVGVEDFGTAMLIGVVGGVLLVVAGARFWHLLVLAVPAGAAAGALLVSKPYRIRRLTSFLDIWSDPQGAGYHPVQSLIGIASGGVIGEGLGGSIQKFGYLPESRTDFIFSIWAEETGLIGCLTLMLLFAALLYLGVRAALSASSLFERLLAVAVTLTVVLQATINIAVVTVSVPTKGIALPLVSAGGSGVLCLSVALGLLAGVALRGRYATTRRTTHEPTGRRSPGARRGKL